MKQGSLNLIITFGAFITGYLIFEFTLPQFIKDGGPLVVVLVALSIMVVTYIVERLLSLKKADGHGPLPKYLKTLVINLNSNDISAAIAACILWVCCFAGFADDTASRRWRSLGLRVYFWSRQDRRGLPKKEGFTGQISNPATGTDSPT